MKTIRWSDVKTYDDWKSTLKQILDAAATASQANDDDERLDLCSVLNEFIARSAPNSDEIKDLDRVAGEAIEAMADQVAQNAIGRIAQRTATITTLAKEVDLIAQKANEAASDLRLGKFHAAVDALTEAERAVSSLGDAVESGSDDQLKSQIVDLIKAINKARAALDKNK